MKMDRTLFHCMSFHQLQNRSFEEISCNLFFNIKRQQVWIRQMEKCIYLNHEHTEYFKKVGYDSIMKHQAMIDILENEMERRLYAQLGLTS